MLSLNPVRPDEVSLLLSLIRELAEFEKLSHEVVATEDVLRDSLFGERRVAEAILARIDDVPAGFALYYHSFSTFLGRPGLYLEDLYVRSDHRGKGVGTALLTHVAAVAVERRCGRLEWEVLEEIRLLGNLENRHGKLLQIILAGQPEFDRLGHSP